VSSNEPLEQLADLLVNDEILCEMYLYSELNCKSLDYSVDSLRSIDTYLSAVHKAPPEEDDLVRVILRVGAYIGEVIRRNTDKELNWLDFDEASQRSSLVSQLGKQASTLAVLWAEPNSITFPLGKVQKFLDVGDGEGTHFFVTTILTKFKTEG
jgi:hypothetical protein